MRNLDAMGYNAASTDPLYKHIPFTITRGPEASFGLFYDNPSSCWLDLGNEIDNYHTAYRRYQAEAGDLDYYLFLGPKVVDVTKAFVRLTGRTHFGPKWSLGYSGSTMHYTDAPDAQQQLQQFIALCRQHAIPCDSFQLSSGYTSINNKRYVFNWNYDKVPQPKQLSQAFHDAGLRLAANIKPCLLQDHPQYQAVAAQGLFIRDSQSDAPERSSFWDDEDRTSTSPTRRRCAGGSRASRSSCWRWASTRPGTTTTSMKCGTVKRAATASGGRSPSSTSAR